MTDTLAHRLDTYFKAHNRLAGMTNSELAHLLLENVWKTMVFGSPQEMLISEVISRLAPELDAVEE